MLMLSLPPLPSALEQNEEQVSVAVDGSDLEMTDGAAHSKSGGDFNQGTSHVLDDVAEVTVVGSKRVSSALPMLLWLFMMVRKVMVLLLLLLLKMLLFPLSGFSSTELIVSFLCHRHIIRSSPSFGMANVCNLLSFLLIIRRASLASFVQPDPFAFSILVQASRMGCFSSVSFGMNLLMAVSCRNKLCVWFGLLRVGLRMIACILPGSALSPSSVTIWQINLPSFTLN
ncbi:hypothetical protein Tco_0077625 [Tanacetum coccineum]